MPPAARDYNRRTIEGYERCARDYAAEVPREPSLAAAAALRRLADAIPPGGQVLDIGSGPGWDADFLETLGVRVHRTDVAAAFREFQAERGKRVDPLDLLADDIPGRYHGILMLCVLQHFERTQLDAALRKLAGALSDAGVVLLQYPEGADEFWEHGASGDYRVVRWARDALDGRLALAGFTVEWEAAIDGRDGSWRSVLARKRA